MTIKIDACPICKCKLSAEVTTGMNGEVIKFNCPNCGKYEVSKNYYDDSLVNNNLRNTQLAILSHAIRRMQSNRPQCLIDQGLASSILQSTTLPTAIEQLDNLVLYLGKNLTEPGQKIKILHRDMMRATLGSITAEGSEWVIEQAIELGLMQGTIFQTMAGGEPVHNATLSISGWQRFTELQTTVSGSKRAFMAMKFGDTELENVFLSYFKPAAKSAGYELYKLDDQPTAGLIDDRLRLEIRTSRFLIADLSHANNGAYWEAGYAEGLGRPVIYTCKQSVFDNKDSELRPHFDTNHYLIVPWDPSDLQKAADTLTTTIRATLPSEAILTNR